MNVSIKRDNHRNASFSPPSQIAEVLDDEAVRIFLEFERVESAIKGQCLVSWTFQAVPLIGHSR